MTWLICAVAEPAQAQVPPGVSVGFSNNSQTAVIVKGYTIVNGAQRPGLLLPMKKGGKAYDTNVPAGLRYYTVYDANNPTRVLLRDHQVPIQNRDTFLNIIMSPLDSTRVVIVGP